MVTGFADAAALTAHSDAHQQLRATLQLSITQENLLLDPNTWPAKQLL